MRTGLRSAARGLAILALSALVTACAPKPTKIPEVEKPHALLTGGWWHLVEIRLAKDDVVRPKDPLRYTLTFNADGSAEMQLDCNRGRGKYTTRKDELRLGPLAVTRAFCAPPSLSDRIARDMDNVRSYKIDGNRLMLGLAGGGNYVWEQASLD